MKNQVEKHELDRTFEVGVWVYLKPEPYRLLSLEELTNQKLSKRYGPFEISQKIGSGPYKLNSSTFVKNSSYFLYLTSQAL